MWLSGERQTHFVSQCGTLCHGRGAPARPTAGLQSQDKDVEAQGHLSYVSGHTSFAFMVGFHACSVNRFKICVCTAHQAMVLLALYLSGKLKTFSEPKNTFPKFVLGVLAPICLAGYVAVTRVSR